MLSFASSRLKMVNELTRKIMTKDIGVKMDKMIISTPHIHVVYNERGYTMQNV